ncbi:Homocysteine S-methyltransferase [Lasiosphaeria miniovina]|uniref:Homocysteine S-methyltransferase n=1 Tax=Lasiosphaeria miniovina TaxID=1954250 RepID=A0AA40EDQ5_9PEZI|nr:Homocysteine S-methyltransferase [Lasiosphaeria miniovina]KAK0734602.1 Homocysteine S-methyltransferase [Lasiosphaeria miniovina]
MRDGTPILILDGGLGTSLEDKYGVVFSEQTPLWSSHLLVADQQKLLACQSDFAQAGADVLLTATYQASIEGFAATRTAEWPRGVSIANVGQFLEDAVLIARQTGAPRVALSLGPYGATMVPSTEYSARYDGEHDTADKLEDWHTQRFMLFAKVAGLLRVPDYLAFETIPRVDEILAIRRLLAAQSHLLTRFGEFSRTGMSAWISCVFPGDGETLPDGTSVEEVVVTALSTEVASVVPWGIGINCTRVAKLPGLLRRFESAVQALVDAGGIVKWPSLVLCPDGTNGEVYNTATKTWEFPEEEKTSRTPWQEQIFEAVKGTRARGKWESILVGGCCKTTDSDIERLRWLVEEEVGGSNGTTEVEETASGSMA